MVQISDTGIITMIRGDTASFPLFINAGTELNPVQLTLGDNDTLYFAVTYPNQKFEDAVIKKIYTSNSLTDDDGDIIIFFDSSDTECLQEGKYFYQAKLRTIANSVENVNTVLPKREFWII